MIRLRLSHLMIPTLAVAALAAVALPGSAQPTPPTPPTPQTPPSPPSPPRPPRPPRPPIAVTLPDDVRGQVQAELERALAEVENNDNIPPKMKVKIKIKLKASLGKLAKKSKIDVSDLTQLGEDLDGMGEDLDAWGDQMSQDIQQQVRDQIERAMARSHRGHGPGPNFNPFADGDDHDGDHAEADGDDHDGDHAEADGDDDHDDDKGDDGDRDDGDMPMPDPFNQHGHVRPPMPMPPHGSHGHGPVVVIDDLDDPNIDVDIDSLQLTHAQRVDLKKIAADEKAAVTPAVDKIAELSDQLRAKVADVDADQADVDHLVDAITAQEATIRKARLAALARTRKLLTSAQRDKVQPHP